METECVSICLVTSPSEYNRFISCAFCLSINRSSRFVFVGLLCIYIELKMHGIKVKIGLCVETIMSNNFVMLHSVQEFFLFRFASYEQ
jgi:hypothetical protein